MPAIGQSVNIAHLRIYDAIALGVIVFVADGEGVTVGGQDRPFGVVFDLAAAVIDVLVVQAQLASLCDSSRQGDFLYEHLCGAWVAGQRDIDLQTGQSVAHLHCQRSGCMFACSSGYAIGLFVVPQQVYHLVGLIAATIGDGGLHVVGRYADDASAAVVYWQILIGGVGADEEVGQRVEAVGPVFQGLVAPIAYLGIVSGLVDVAYEGELHLLVEHHVGCLVLVQTGKYTESRGAKVFAIHDSWLTCTSGHIIVRASRQEHGTNYYQVIFYSVCEHQTTLIWSTVVWVLTSIVQFCSAKIAIISIETKFFLVFFFIFLRLHTCFCENGF